MISDLDGWDGEWEGGPRRKGRYKHIADSLHCSAETNKHCKAAIPPKKRIKNNKLTSVKINKMKVNQKTNNFE